MHREHDAHHRTPPDEAHVVCLLPARNAARLLPGWFASAAELADAVVALDDGSEDETGEMLRSHPLVATVLANPVRAGYAGWDDAANRRALLAAAAPLHPRWIMQLDADERMPADDARALRAFLADGADPAFAYRFRVYRMVSDLDHYDAGHEQWVARCFAYDPAHRLPTQRLHFVAVPTAFTPERRVRTTFRIQHLVGLTAEDRRRQHDKYAEADPTRAHQSDYSHLLRAPTDVRPWAARSADLHSLANRPAPWAGTGPARVAEPGPAVSIVVDARNDPARATAVTRLRARVPFEVIVVGSTSAPVVDPEPPPDAAAGPGTRAPEVVTVTVAPGTPAAAARAAGIARARGALVVVTPGAPLDGYVDALHDAYAAGHPLVAGVVCPDRDSAAGIAALAIAQPEALVGAPGGPLPVAATASAWSRDAWAEHGAPAPETDPARVTRDALARGYAGIRTVDAVTRETPPASRVVGLVRWAFTRGIAGGRRAATARPAWEALGRVPLPLRPPARRAYPLVGLAASATAVGAVVGRLRRLRRGPAARC